MKDGGYDIGYKECICFWGTNPGSLLLKIDNYISDYQDKKVLDLGCGEAKNSIYLAKKGCSIDAFDVSNYAINNAYNLCKNYSNINLKQVDVTSISYPKNTYDIIIAYGLFHCFDKRSTVETITKSCLLSLKDNGIFVVCAFNNRKHDLSAHIGFNPLLLTHLDYLSFFRNNTILYESDQDLFEVHPHNNIPHMHSMTRLIIKK